MKAWRVRGQREMSALAIEEIPLPTRKPGEIRVAVAYAAVNFADGLMIRGQYQVRPELPFTPGFEVSGTVIEAGSESMLKIGDRVCGQVAWGGFAEQVTAPEERWMRLPDGAGLASAAALPISYITAHIALYDKAGLGSQDTLVVLAAAGGVGRAAIELAAGREGLTVALIGSERKRSVAMSAGADVVINYNESDWVSEVRALTKGKGAEAVLDPVGGSKSLDGLRALAWRGHLLLVGFAGGQPAQLPANRLLVKSATAHGVFWSHAEDMALVQRTQHELMARWQSRQISPLVSEILPFDRLRDAVRAIENGGTVGKLLLRIAP